MNHLKDVGENYFKHGLTALWVSANLFFLFVVSLIHAIFPFIFTNETSNGIFSLAEQMEERKSQGLLPTKPEITD